MAAPASTPLSLAFYSKPNIARLQQGISQAIQTETGYRIEPQNPADLFVLMQAVYAKTFSDPYSDIERQIERINAAVVKEALGIMKPRIAQQVIYTRNLDTLPPPPDWPGNTSTYGKKLPFNNKVGF
ncbi:hypothetical protein EBT31_05350 [bacterium]|nr:hypothetical protein [bacterium]